MKNLKTYMSVKITAGILLFIMGAITILSIYMIGYNAERGIYVPNVNFYNTDICHDIMNYYARNIYDNILNIESIVRNKEAASTYGDVNDWINEARKNAQELRDLTDAGISSFIEKYRDIYDSKDFNFYYTVFNIKDTKVNIIYKNYKGELSDEVLKTGYMRGYNYPYYDIGNLYINIYLKSEITTHDWFYYGLLYFNMRYGIIFIALISVIIFTILFVFLLSSAGYNKKGEHIIVPLLIDKIPIDLLCVIIIFTVCLISYFIYKTWYYIHRYDIYVIAFLSLFSIAFLPFIMSFAVRCKMKTLIKTSVTYQLLYIIYKIFKRIGIAIRNIIINLPILWKFILCAIAFLILNSIFITARAYIEYIILINILISLLATAAICIYIIGFDTLKKASYKIAAGDLEYKIKTSGMLFDLKVIGDNMNLISDGMNNALNERIRSEHLKSELITNVSHDIKTPLTSLINYVDLLKKEEINNETALSYIEILDRQANKLRKLTDDLIEASKAATGNIPLNIADVNLSELLRQSTGEYSERLKSINVEVIENIKHDNIVIQSDGRLLWRIFDNLLNNIYKYSMRNTRIYIDMQIVNNSVVISMKNISREPLNLAADELMERFVRGDASRATEGSGLGLSIARSLTEFLSGVFNISIDGDLFKVTITFHI